ncbi:hypothetical protein H4V95_002597 [Arthrobacter sp. CAN_C5]|nr:hypothetical protein [Arthrobacter sp. CAN_C5]
MPPEGPDWPLNVDRPAVAGLSEVLSVAFGATVDQSGGP